MKLNDKVAIITGGSRGIGKFIAAKFLSEGAKVVIAARNSGELNRVVSELSISGKNIIGLKTDVSRPKEVERLIRHSTKIYGAIDILVNAASIQNPIGPLIKVKTEDWIKNIKINLIGTMLCCKYALPVMISRKKGKIINFSGGGAMSSRPNFSAYASAKVAVVRFSETIADEVKNLGIDVNSIAPGSVNTKMVDDIIQSGPDAGKEELEKSVRIKREGGTGPELAAELAVFLASDASNGITGKLISAVWDNWRNINQQMEGIKNSSLFTLRRIDGRVFIEAKST